MVLLEAIALLAGMALLVKGSDFFVQAASDIAERAGVSEFVVGLTIVAFGTSVPELAASLAASTKGASGLIIGNAIGSNIANIGLIVGLTAAVSAAATQPRMLERDGYLAVFAGVILLLLGLDGSIQVWEAVLMLGLYAAYLTFLLESGERDEEAHIVAFIQYFLTFGPLDTVRKTLKRPTREQDRKLLIQDLAVLILSGAAIIIGARFLVEEALYFANHFHVPEALIGITIISLGTSLPELSVTIAAARKGLGDIAIGNVLGSNIANILLIIGASALVSPLAVSASALIFAIPIMLGFTLALLLAIRTGWRLSRREGFILLGLYAATMILFVLRPGLTG